MLKKLWNNCDWLSRKLVVDVKNKWVDMLLRVNNNEISLPNSDTISPFQYSIEMVKLSALLDFKIYTSFIIICVYSVLLLRNSICLKQSENRGTIQIGKQNHCHMLF